MFNANSAILNALLTLLNEREFDNGRKRMATPLVSVIAASNHVPEGPELAALHDRFLFRCHVRPVSQGRFRALLDAPRTARALERTARLTTDELEATRRLADRVPLSPSVRVVFEAMRKAMNEKNHYVSDRRWKKIARVLRVAALCDGRAEVSLTDASLMVHCLWDRPDQIEMIEGLLRTTLDAALVDEPKRYEAMAKAFDERIAKERASLEHVCDADGRPLYYDELGDETTDPYQREPATSAKGDLLYRAPPRMRDANGRTAFSMSELWEKHFQDQPEGFARFEAWCEGTTNQVFEQILRKPVKTSARYSSEHVEARRRQLEDLAGEVASLQRAVAVLRGREGASFWVSDDRRRAIAERFASAERTLAPIEARLLELVSSARALPGRPA